MNESLCRINLRVVSKLQPGDRLQCCDSRYFGIDRGYMVWLWRWMKGDTRNIMLERLEDTVKTANDMAKDDHSIKELLRLANSGLKHLLDTYHTDPTTVSRLEAISDICTGDNEIEL